MLISDGGSGQTIGSLGAVRALAMAGHTAHVAMSHPLAVAGWSRHCARRIRVPSLTEPEAYAAAIRSLADSGDYETVLLASDAALCALRWPGMQLVDKAEVARRAARAGFAQAREELFADGAALVAAAERLEFPVVVKPVQKHQYVSSDPFRVDGPDDLRTISTYPSPVLVQEWLPGTLRGLSGVVWQGRLRAVVHQSYARTWPRVCGAASISVTVAPDLDLEARVVEVLGDYDGLFNVQYLGEHLIDVNPRIYGSVLTTPYAGVNALDVVTRLAAGEDVGRDAPLRAAEGVRFRWLEGDLRSLADGVRAGSSSWRDTFAALRPRRRVVHGDLDWRDPLPTTVRGFYVVRELLSI